MALPGFLQKRLDKVNGIIAFFEDPCQAPWTVYIELAKAPAIKVLLVLLELDLTDIIRGFARPKGVRGFRHLPRGKRNRRRGGGIPDPNELIAKKIPGQKAFSQRVVSNGVKTLWFVDGVIQRFLWWWLVADLLTDFLYDWTSLINKSEFCKAGSIASSKAMSGGFGIINHVTQTNPVFTTVEKVRGEFTTSPNPVFALQTQNGFVSVGITYGSLRPNFPVTSMSMWLEDITTGQELDRDTIFGSFGELMVSANFPKQHTIVVWIKPETHEATQIKSMAWAYGTPAS